MANPITIFTPASQDLSLQYLYTIFGDMNGVINAYGITALAPGTTTLTILGTMFQTFNSILLAIGAFVVVYVTVVGVMATAHEGQFMGKKWNNMWLPIRTVLGIASLVPTASGYSAVQIIMMWIITQGIGAADGLWSTTLDFVSRTGSPYTKLQTVLNSTSANGSASGLASIAAKQALKDIFKGIACNETARIKNTPPPFSQQILWITMPLSAGYYCTSNPSDPACSEKDFSASTMRQSSTISLGPAQSCGTISYCNYQTACNGQSQTACNVCTQQIDALSQILTLFVSRADQLVATDLKYSYYFYQGSNNSNTQPPQFIQDYCNSNGISQQNCKATVTINSNNNNNNGSSGSSQPSVSTAGLPAPFTSSPFDQSASSYVVSNIYVPALKNSIMQGSPYVCPNSSSSTSSGTGSSTSSSANQNQDFMAFALSVYQCAITTGFSQSPPGPSPTQSSQSQLPYEQGWLGAGSYYYSLSGFVKQAVNDANPPLSYSAPSPDLSLPINLLYFMCDGKQCRTNFAAADYLEQYLQQVQIQQQSSSSSGGGGNNFGSSSTSSGGSSPADALSGPISDATSSINSTLYSTMTPTGATSNGLGANDPIATLIIVGTILLYVAEIAFVVLMVILLALGLAGNISVWVLGTGFVNPVGPAATLVSLLLMPALMGFLGILIVVGGTLSIYVPLIPFVIFTLGAIGWFTSVIEAMVAGPLVALGILSPSGQHELLGKAEPAVGLLFNIFLRPSLMIFGMVAAVLLAGTMIDLLNTTFGTVFNQIGLEHALDPVGLVLFLIAYVSLVVTVLNKCFAAIHIIPEKVGRWIGMQGEQYGESTDALKGAIESGAQRAGGAMKSTSDAANRAREDDAKRGAKENQADVSTKPKGDGKS